MLSRWSVEGCANCQTHLEVKAFFGVPAALADVASAPEIKIHTRDGVLAGPDALAATPGAPPKRLFRLEVRDAS